MVDGVPRSGSAARAAERAESAAGELADAAAPACANNDAEAGAKRNAASAVTVINRRGAHFFE